MKVNFTSWEVTRHFKLEINKFSYQIFDQKRQYSELGVLSKNLVATKFMSVLKVFIKRK